jgi:hypothetical protein
MNHPIIIANKTIRSDSYERFCLNDLHKAAGGQPRHIPSKWLRTQQVKDLIDEIEISQIRAIETKQKTGTFGCRELIYAYATWISPAFFLKVIRAFDALATGTFKDTVSTMLFRARKAGKIAKGPKQGTLARDAKRGVQ